MAAPHWLRPSALKESRLEKQPVNKSSKTQDKICLRYTFRGNRIKQHPKLNRPMAVVARQDLWRTLSSFVICLQKPKTPKWAISSLNFRL